MVRTTEQTAPEKLRELIYQLAALTAANQPTTALEEALDKLPHIAQELRTWISSRHLIAAHAAQAAAFHDRHPAIAVNSPAEDEAMDLLEAQAIERAHPTAGLLAAFSKDIAS